ncbi:universal stress protein [Persicirhabdus sediminis]|uniref:Universal stress protein n=1 Tax=Persicirhabdus sediminis TaxID=454144 RepID=A0A8J7MEY7_9BACT|nr:universal stress protein [Persicirhabdus sediminis]MBK1792137.1 universal stress protein [Persicirhabdus sediminis]
MKRIVAALDFSDTTPLVIAEAGKLARALNETLYLVHVVEAEPVYTAYGFTADEFPAMHEYQAEAAKRGQKRLDQAVEEMGAVGVVTKLLEGSPLFTLLEFVDEIEADMLILGAHGHGWLGSLLLGSVAEGAIRRSKVPIMVVPAPKKKDKQE